MASPARKGRRHRSATEDKQAALTRHIETAIKTSDENFVAEYMHPSPGWERWTHPKTKDSYSVKLVGVEKMSDSELEDCYELVDATSGADYRSSSFGWHPVAKKREMRSPELRYLLVTESDGYDSNQNKAEDNEQGNKGRIRGFTSMMPTFENGDPVVYCYEIHLRPELQGTGLGRQLMEHVHSVATHVPGVEKTMLTCFVSNERGMSFYKRLGFEVDESSPRDRKLRGGKVVKADYAIMSRKAQR